MKLKRIVPPIGHGAFYIEKFEDGFVTVFDCGSNNKRELFREIDKIELERINILFISHFDDDHVNGISRLAKKCRIDYVVMPYLYESKLLYLSETICNGGTEDTLQLISNPNKFFEKFNNETKIVNVLPADINIETISNDMPYVRSGENVLEKIAFPKKTIKWKYVLHNSSFDANAAIIKIEIETMLKNKFQKDDLDYSWIIKNMESLKIELKKILKSHKRTCTGDKSASNVNSLVMYSGPVGNCEANVMYSNIYKRLISYNKPGFLYCGDYNAHDYTLFNELKRVLGDYKNYCGGVQIPHHGSENNYNTEIIDEYQFGIVSVGVNGTHGGKFPHDIVVYDVVKKSELCVVTNQGWTNFVQCIELNFM